MSKQLRAHLERILEQRKREGFADLTDPEGFDDVDEYFAHLLEQAAQRKETQGTPSPPAGSQPLQSAPVAAPASAAESNPASALEVGDAGTVNVGGRQVKVRVVEVGLRTKGDNPAIKVEYIREGKRAKPGAGGQRVIGVSSFNHVSSGSSESIPTLVGEGTIEGVLRAHQDKRLSARDAEGLLIKMIGDTEKTRSVIRGELPYVGSGEPTAVSDSARKLKELQGKAPNKEPGKPGRKRRGGAAPSSAASGPITPTPAARPTAPAAQPAPLDLEKLLATTSEFTPASLAIGPQIEKLLATTSEFTPTPESPVRPTAPTAPAAAAPATPASPQPKQQAGSRPIPPQDWYHQWAAKQNAAGAAQAGVAPTAPTAPKTAGMGWKGPVGIAAGIAGMLALPAIARAILRPEPPPPPVPVRSPEDWSMVLDLIGTGRQAALDQFAPYRKRMELMRANTPRMADSIAAMNLPRL